MINPLSNTLTVSDLTLAERETHISQTADNRSRWEVYSDDPVIIAKYDRLVDKALPEENVTRVEKGVGVKYNFPKNYVRVKAPRRVTEEQRVRLAKQLIKNKASKE